MPAGCDRAAAERGPGGSGGRTVAPRSPPRSPPAAARRVVARSLAGTSVPGSTADAGTFGRVLYVPPRREVGPRLPRLLPGLLLCGVGLALMVEVRLGLGPWDVLHQGISRRTGVPIGTVGILVGLAVLFAWIPLRQRLGVGTIFNVVLVGVLIDVSMLVIPPLDDAHLVARAVGFLVGLGMMSVGTPMYIGAGLGPGPRDGLMTALADRGYSLRVVRTVLELAALGFGWALGGDVGVGTVVFALGIGPAIHAVLPRLMLPPIMATPHVATAIAE